MTSYLWLLQLIFAWSLVLVSPVLQLAYADSGGLQTSLAVDLVGTAFSKREGDPATKIEVREAELFFYAPIDHLFDGTLGIAAHQENGAALFEIHEATIGSSKLIPWSRFRIGQYFLGIGKLNSVHRHDWPFTTAPKVHQAFFGQEGVDDTGIEISVLPPLPVYLDLTVGLTGGWKFGHVHNAGKEPEVPTHYARIAYFAQLPLDGGLQTGVNYLQRVDFQGDETMLLGLDLVAKWRRARVLPFFLQAEVWQRSYKTAAQEGATGAPLERAIGFYAFPQFNVFESLDLGLRYDGYTISTLTDAAGKTEANYDQSFVPALTWKPSEFSTFRVSYVWELAKKGSSTKLENSYLELQSTFILGAHPAHDF